MNSHAVTALRDPMRDVVTDYGDVQVRQRRVRTHDQAKFIVAHPDIRDEISCSAETLRR